MSAKRYSKLNKLHRLLPEGLLADAAWFNARGYPSNLRAGYAAAGWLEEAGPGVYRRPLCRAGFEEVAAPLRWQHVVVSLQLVMGYPLAVGGATALTLLGHAHYIPFREPVVVELFGDGPAPAWLARLGGGTGFRFLDGRRLFRTQRVAPALAALKSHMANDALHWHQPFPCNFTYSNSAGPDWPILLSRPERAILEVMDGLPGDRTRFHGADMLMENLYDLHPNRVEELLRDCRSIKVKRLFLWFASRHGHAWLEDVDLTGVDLGRGKRSFWAGGTYDPKYRVVMPVAELDAGG